MYLEDPGVNTPVSGRVVIFLSQKRISIKIGVTDCHIFSLNSMKTTLFKRLRIVGATLRREIHIVNTKISFVLYTRIFFLQHVFSQNFLSFTQDDSLVCNSNIRR